MSAPTVLEISNGMSSQARQKPAHVQPRSRTATGAQDCKETRALESLILSGWAGLQLLGQNDSKTASLRPRPSRPDAVCDGTKCIGESTPYRFLQSEVKELLRVCRDIHDFSHVAASTSSRDGDGARGADSIAGHRLCDMTHVDDPAAISLIQTILSMTKKDAR